MRHPPLGRHGSIAAPAIKHPPSVSNLDCKESGLSMSAYIIAIINVTNPAAYAEYARLAAPVNAQFNSRLLARGSGFEFLEGKLDCNRVVINRFETMEAAKAFYHSVEYQTAREKRAGAADFNMLVIEGTD